MVRFGLLWGCICILLWGWCEGFVTPATRQSMVTRPRLDMASLQTSSYRHHTIQRTHSHAASAIASSNDEVVEPSLAEQVRTGVLACRSGTLSTISAETEAPLAFGSYSHFIIDANGSPIVMLSQESVHAKNIRSNPVVCTAFICAIGPLDIHLLSPNCLGISCAVSKQQPCRQQQQAGVSIQSCCSHCDDHR
jgi:hypothetical protein